MLILLDDSNFYFFQLFYAFLFQNFSKENNRYVFIVKKKCHLSNIKKKSFILLFHYGMSTIVLLMVSLYNRICANSN